MWVCGSVHKFVYRKNGRFLKSDFCSTTGGKKLRFNKYKILRWKITKETIEYVREEFCDKLLQRTGYFLDELRKRYEK